MSNQPESSCSRKRPRTGSVADAEPWQIPSEDLERHAELWLEDGNIVLVAQNVGFRVYKGILTKQSYIVKEGSLPYKEIFLLRYLGAIVAHVATCIRFR